MSDPSLHCERTAVLVIHGIGQQNPYETLDGFARTLWNVLDEQTVTRLAGRHQIRAVGDEQAHFLSIFDPENEAHRIDVHELYWAHHMTDATTLVEIVDWLLQVSDGARKYYGENEALRQQYESRGVDLFGTDGKVRPRWYLRHVGWLLRGLGLLRHFQFPAVRFLDPIIRGLMRRATRVIVDFVGDVAVYTTADVKAKHYEVRVAILTQAVERLTSLLVDYDRVLVVGHSLGSVIAHDTLNRINLAMNTKQVDPELARRVAGLVTFGSPLDKIAFFFREHANEDQYVRRQILAHLHSFKARRLDLRDRGRELADPVQPYLDHVRWLNFWDPDDPISGHLDFYEIPDEDNVQYAMGEPWGLAHTAYWQYAPMFERIAVEFLGDSFPRPSSSSSRPLVGRAAS